MTTRITPNHEQLWPGKLLSHRLEEYVLDDGSPPTTNRAFAKRVTGQQVLDTTVAVQGGLGTAMSNVDPRYYVGTCFHEAGCVNEWDTEIASPTCHEGFVSVGAFQIGREEATTYGFKLEDMLNLDDSTHCMIRLGEHNRAEIRRAANLGPGQPDPDYTDLHGVVWKGGTMRAYMAIAHNHGLGYVRSTLKNYPLDWSAYKARNPQDRIVSNRYGEDCITGGPQYPSKILVPPPGHRLLELRNPWMTGEDVAELQRHLKIDPDGAFGPDTKAAVIKFQQGHGLNDDGRCGDLTWTALLAT